MFGLPPRDVLAVAALGLGLVSAACPALQARRMLARRSAGDVSLGWLGVYAVGCLAWLLYGISAGDTPLIITEAIAAPTSAATVVVAARLRRAAARRRAGAWRAARDAPPGALHPGVIGAGAEEPGVARAGASLPARRDARPAG